MLAAQVDPLGDLARELLAEIPALVARFSKRTRRARQASQQILPVRPRAVPAAGAMLTVVGADLSRRDYAALGGRVIRKSECGNYGDESLTAWKLPGGEVVIERIGRGGEHHPWSIAASDSLRVSSHAWGNFTMCGVETLLVAVPETGEGMELARFEFDVSSGGPTNEQVAELAQAIGSEAGCTVAIVPIVVPASWTTDSVNPAWTRKPVPPRAPVTEPPLPPTGVLYTLRGVVILGTLEGGDDNEPLRAIRFPEGLVVLENGATASSWKIMRSDILIVAAYDVAGGGGGCCTYLARKWPDFEERIAAFHHWDGDRKGPDEAAVVAFVETLVAATGCTLEHRAYVWG